jgi:runt-related transcription factor 1
MLNCILGMVDKTKRALAVLQERSLRDREEVAAWLRRQTEGMEQDVKKHHPAHDVMAAFHVTRHHHDDRLEEIRRRAGRKDDDYFPAVLLLS